MRVVTSTNEVIELGEVETAPTIGIIDYSRRVTDDFGVTTVVERGFARRMSVRLKVAFDEVDALQRRLADLRAASALWIADDRFASLSVNGFYKDFEVDLAVPPISFCTLTVEGLTASEAFTDPGGDPAPAGQPSTLQMLQPTTVTDAMLAMSSVAEGDYAEWSADTTYPIGARVIKAATHRIYESAIGGNIGDDPAGASGKWFDVGPTNRWAMFDQALGSATSAAGSIVVVLDAGVVDGVTLLDVTASTVRVQAPGYDRTISVGGSNASFLDLPGADLRVTVTISGFGLISVGTLLVGRMALLGVTEASPTAGITDYSRKDVDDFGEVTVVQRAWAKRMTAKALIRTDAIDAVGARIAAVRARPSLWIGQAGLDSLTIYGFFKDFSIEVGEAVSKLSLSIEGLSTAAPIAPALPPVIAWPDITDPEGTKPADNATVGAPVGTTIGGVVQPDGSITGGMPAGLALTTLEKIVPIEAATDLLKQANINQDAILRQADDAKQLLAQEQLRAVLAANTQRVTLRDAGLFVDPETGRVGITAVDQTQDRVSKVEINLDAVTGQIALRATYNDVASAIAQAQLNPGQAADLSNIIARLNSAEVSLSGLNAAIVLKADAVTVTQLGGLVQSVSQTLDALAGVVATKASTTSVTALGERVGSAETILSSLGDLSSFSISLRQADVRNTSASLGALSNLLADDDANRRQIVAAAEVNQQLYARLVDGDAAEAASRLLLTARVGAAEGRLANEELVRADQYGALARSTTALQSSYNDLAGSVQTLRQATADADQANATAITQVSARIGDFGLVSVQQAFNVLATRTGQLEGQYTLSISTNGRLQGYKLAGSASGPATFSFIDTDLNMGTGRIIFNNGSFMQVQGIGFGADGKLIEWYGPSLANLAQCTIDNAIAYKTNDGRAVFRGATGSGAAPLSVSTFAIGANQLTSPAWAKTSAVTRVQAAFSWSNYGVRATPQPGAVPEVTLILYRKLGSAAEVEVGRVTQTGYTAFDDTSPAAFDQNVNANLAYADSDASTDTRVWRVAAALTSNIPGGSSSRPDELAQSITITATPQ